MKVLISGLLTVSLLIGAVVVLAPGSEAGTWTCGASTYTSDPLSEVVQNGGFESDLSGWYSRGVPPAISTAIVHSGAKSAHVVAQVADPVHGEQDLSAVPGDYVFSHWFFVSAWRGDGVFATALMRNWIGSSADMVSRLWWAPPTLLWQVWVPAGGGGWSTTLDVFPSTGRWRLIEIVVSASQGTQCLFIDGANVATANVSPANTFAPAVVVFGDVTQAGDAGDAYWDDISILSVSRGSPDYIPTNPLPATAIQTGTSLPTALSVTVQNQGNASAVNASSLAFYNESTPGSLFATFAVPALGAGLSSGPFTATWISPSVPGSYRIVAEVDYGDSVAEANEGNNRYTWTATVYPPPVTTLTVGTPSYGGTFVTSATLLTLAVVDRSGTGIRRTAYRIDGGSWQDYTSPFVLAGEGDHLVEFFSEDNVGNVEAIQSTSLVVDDTGPAATVAPGTPNDTATDTWVTSSTPVSILATDLGPVPVGVDRVDYRVWSGTWSAWSPYSTPFTVPPEGRRYVEWRASDHLGNTGAGNRSLIVDDTPPASAFALSGPTVTDSARFVTSATQIALSSTDGGVLPVGVATLVYSLDGTTWSPYSTAISLTGADGPRALYFRGTDRLGNAESTRVLNVVLDNTPPTTTIAIPEGPLSVASRFGLSATDAGCGVDTIEYRVDGGAWQTYQAPFALPIGDHVVGYRSADRLGNVEQEKTVTIRVENWKPFVALAFAVVLGLLAVLLAWRARREEGARWKRLLVGGIVFAVAEGVTGILSALLGILPIPPFLDLGTIVDTAFLVAGLVTVVALFLRARPSRTAVPPPRGTPEGLGPQPPRKAASRRPVAGGRATRPSRQSS